MKCAAGVVVVHVDMTAHEYVDSGSILRYELSFAWRGNCTKDITVDTSLVW